MVYSSERDVRVVVVLNVLEVAKSGSGLCRMRWDVDVDIHIGDGRYRLSFDGALFTGRHR